jgi:hypothetical protein
MLALRRCFIAQTAYLSAGESGYALRLFLDESLNVAQPIENLAAASRRINSRRCELHNFISRSWKVCLPL